MMVTALARWDLDLERLIMQIAIKGSPQLGHWLVHLEFQMRLLSLIAFPFDEQQSLLEYSELF